MRRLPRTLAATRIPLSRWERAGGRGPRRGATLMEVTICILIMAIGVLGVATLFPISLMHSIKAHQLTSGTIHRYGAESFVDATKYVYRDPDRDRNELEHGTAANPWEGAWLFDPLGTSDPNATPPGFGLSAGADAFENSPFPDNNNTIARYPGSGATDPRWTLPQADELIAAQDTWVERFVGSAGGGDTDPRDGLITVPNVRNAGFPTGVISSGVFPRTRAVMFFFDPLSGRRKSVTREVERLRLDVVMLRLSTNPDPTLPAAVDEVRIETQDRRFSWLITVRRLGSVVGTPNQHAAEMDVVVFFNRSFEAIDEQVVWANFQQGSATVDIRWAGDRPRLKRGSWILDANNGHWYQISDFGESTNANQAQLTLVGSARADSPVAAGSPDGRAVFMRGVVTVYPLDSKSWHSST